MEKIKEIIMYVVKLAIKISRLPDEKFVFFISLSFLLLLWITNLNNKGMAVLWLLYSFVLYVKLRKLDITIILAYFLSSIFFVGKVYFFYLMDLHGIKYNPAYSDGYLINAFVVTFTDVFAYVVFFLLVRNIFQHPKCLLNIKKIDVIIFLFLLIKTSTDLFVSEDIIISLIMNKNLYLYFTVYIYMRIFMNNNNNAKIIKLLMVIFQVLVLFECLFATVQIIIQAPLGRSIETVKEISKFGDVADEMNFQFRPAGTFSHANNLASYLTFFIPFIFYDYLKKHSNNLFYLVVFAILIILVTLSRSAWIGLFISLGFMVLFLKRTQKYRNINIIFKKINIKIITTILLIVSPILMFIFLPRVVNSIYSKSSGGLNYRYMQIKEVLKLFEINPMGVGTGYCTKALIYNFPEGIFAKIPRRPNVFYLLILCENGIITLTVFAFLIIYFAMLNLFRTDLFKIVMLSSFTILLITGLTQVFFYYQLFFLLVYLRYAYNHKKTA